MLDDQQLNGSEQIVEGLLTHPQILQSLKTTQWKDGTMTAHEFTNSESAIQWTTFAKEDLAPLLYPNMCNTLGNSYRAFGYVHGVESFSAIQKMLIRTIGSFAMYMAASKIKSKYRDENDGWHVARVYSTLCIGSISSCHVTNKSRLAPSIYTHIL
jgi:hypothetical protein